MIESKQSSLIKFKDTLNAYNFGSAAANEYITFTMPAAAASSSGRTGDSIEIKTIEFSVNAYWTQTVTTSVGSAMFRLIVFQFVGEVPSAFASTELIEYSATASQQISSPLSYDNNKYLFKTLLDKVVKLDTYNRVQEFKVHLKPKISKLRYDNGVPIWTSGQPAFCLFPLVSDSVVTNTVNFEAIGRLWFYDV